MDSDVRTIADLPFHVMGRFQNATVVGSARGGAVRSVTGKEFFEGVRDLSLGLSALGMDPGERVAIIAESRPEWLSVDLAVLAAGSISVPVYPTLAGAQVRYILQDSAATVAVVSTRLQLEKIQEIRHQLPALHAIVVMDASAAGNTPSVVSLAEATDRGHARMVGEWGVAKQFRDVARAIRPDQLATIIYTSGTTGEPKGVMLTHAALVSNLLRRRQVLDVSDADVGLSFLPLSHTFERMVAWVYLVVRRSRHLRRVVRHGRKGHRPGQGRRSSPVCPCLREAARTHHGEGRCGIRAAAPGSSGGRWPLACESRESTLRGKSAGPLDRLQAGLADRLVLRSVREGLGGRMRYLVSGSAPLGADVAEFFGATRSSNRRGLWSDRDRALLTVNPPDAPRVGSVGKAFRASICASQKTERFSPVDPM